MLSAITSQLIKVVFTLVVICGSGATYGQLKSEDVFYTGEHFDEKNCRVEAYPVWGQLIILNHKNFLSVNFHKQKYFRDSIALELQSYW
jgi:hypothetical protein